MKNKALLLAILMIVSIVLMAGCSAVTPAATTKAAATTAAATSAGATTKGTDAVAGASYVKDEASFAKGIAANGVWLVYTTADLKVTKAMVLEGEFINGRKDTAGKDIIQRKIALYTQDADRKVTARFTLTIPSLTIKSPNARIQSGTVVGDIIVDVNNFELVDTKVTGNVYFTKAEYKTSFKMDATSSISGKNEVKAN